MSGSDLNDNFKANITKIFDKLLKKLNIKENYKLDIATGSAKGDGYVSAVFRVTVTGENADNESVTSNFLVKTAQHDEILRQALPFHDIFSCEANFYENIFPAMDRFQRDRKVKEPFDNVAKCYISSLEDKYELIAFEDLKIKGFDLWTKDLPMPEDYFKLVLPKYGKLHAISFALRDQEPDVFKDLAGTIGRIFKDVVTFGKLKEFFYGTVRKPEEILRNLGYEGPATGYSKAVDEFLTWISNDEDEGDQTVMAHGDCWSSNFMFKHSEHSKPEDVRILDWQLQQLTSPVWDVGYFLFASARGQILKDINKYLDIYYDGFSKFLKELGSDPEKLFPYSDFMEHWKKYAHRSLIISLQAINVTTENHQDAPTFADIDAYTEFTSNRGNKNEVFKQRAVELVLSAYENGLI